MTQTLKENHVETTGLLKKMDGSLTNMAVSLGNVASSQKEIITVLKHIDSKMKPDS